MLTRPARRRSEGGAVAVLVTVVVVAVILPLLALVVDAGLTRLLSGRARAAADAAALGTALLRPAAADVGVAEAEAKRLVAANLSTPEGSSWAEAWASCTDPAPLPTRAPDTPCISFDFAAGTVRVTVPQRAVPTALAGVVGTHTLTAGATATATWTSGGISLPCALCVAGDYDGGTRRVTVTGGDVAVEGDLGVAALGGLTSIGGTVRYAGDLDVAPGTVLPIPVRAPVPAADTDPLAAAAATVAVPPPGTPSTTVSAGQTCGPGVYQDIPPGGRCTGGTDAPPGRPGPPVPVTLGANASGVVLYFTCSRSSGGVTVVAACPSSGAPSFRGVRSSRTLSAPGGGSNLAMVFDPGLSQTQRINGGGQLDVYGSIYAPGTPFSARRSGLTAVHGGRVILGPTSFSSVTTGPGSTVLRIDAPPPSITAPGPGPVRLVPSG